jgi:acetyltransferase-like isoleucine patch superfamily enzyme
MIRATHLHCIVDFRGPVRLGPGFSLQIPDQGTLIVGSGVDFRRGFVCEISGSGRVTVGSGTVFTYNCIVQCTTSIEIGEGCTFAAGTLLVDGSHRFRDTDTPLADQGYDYRPLTIGPRASVMANSTVLNSIGEGAFVGANSVVTEPIPAYCLAVGAPARVIEYFGPGDQRAGGVVPDTSKPAPR